MAASDDGHKVFFSLTAAHYQETRPAYPSQSYTNMPGTILVVGDYHLSVVSKFTQPCRKSSAGPCRPLGATSYRIRHLDGTFD